MRMFPIVLALTLATFGCSAGSLSGPFDAPVSPSTPPSPNPNPPPATQDQQLRQRIVQLSTQERVLSDYTALLVLESDAEYARFGLDRRALANILTINPKTWLVDVLDRNREQPSEPASLEAGPLRLTAVQRQEAPLSLTSSDGAGLQLTRLQARTVIQGPLAFSELHLAFQNPQPRVLEGRFELTLPAGAAISRLAMKQDDHWLEAEVVELQAAREAYEDALHHRQDPALLEKQAGNRFQARIFPIPANAPKEIIVSYSQELTSKQDYVLPLAGLPKIGELEVTASVTEDPRHDPYRLRLKQLDQIPAGDFVLPRHSPVPGLCAQGLALVSVRPQVDDHNQTLDSLLVLFDTSASRSTGYEGQVAILEKLVGDLPPKLRLQVACFDQTVTSVYLGKGGDFKAGSLRQRSPLGATDLSQALRWASAQKDYKRVLLISDGVATAGPARPAPPSGIRLDALDPGGVHDLESLSRLAHAGKGLVLDTSHSLARQMLGQVSNLPVQIAGATWVWPDRLEGVQAGQERLIYASLPKVGQEVEVRLNGHSQTVPVHSVAEPLLRRAVARAEISRLSRSLSQTASTPALPVQVEVRKIWTSAHLPLPGPGTAAYSGTMLEVETLLQAGDPKAALKKAQSWHSKDPGDVVALVALGQCWETLDNPQEAARAYGSIIDLYPSRADLRRYAGSLLECVDGAHSLAVDSFQQARQQRPDHPSSHRLLAYALARQGDLPGAFQVLEEGLFHGYPEGRFKGYSRILHEDLGLIGAAWAAQDPKQEPGIQQRLGATTFWPDGPSTRFVLTWETDANDVDFHIHDREGGHAYYRSPILGSGGQLYADVTTGYGPECFAIPGIPKAFPYQIQIHYYSRGPMGYGMGNLEIVQYDGHGHLKFAERPYIVMNDQAFVDLGPFSAPLP